MIVFDWVHLLENYGDPIERRGVSTCRLGQTFPKYAEFWGKNVLPNRDPSDPSKLRPDLSPNLEGIFNSHYSVFYQLTMAFYQLQNLDNPIIDIATPLYHLGAAVDLTERTFVAVIRAKGNKITAKLEASEYQSRIEKYWNEQYEQSWERFVRDYRPVSLNLHNLADVFNQFVPDNAEYKRVSGAIRHYRNTLIHNLHPLKVIQKSRIYIPREKYLHLYADARWSSRRDEVNIEQFGPMEEVIRELADKLVVSLNVLWDILLKWMEDILPVKDEFDLTSQIIAAIPYLESGMMGRASGVDYPNQDEEFPNPNEIEWLNPRKIDLTDNSSEQIRPIEYKPPTMPSGYKSQPIDKNDEFDDPLL